MTKMVNRLLIIVVLFLGFNSFSQNLTIKNINISLDDKMLTLEVPKIADNITRIVEITRIIPIENKLTSGSRNSFKQSIKNCGTSAKTLLISGEYIFKVTIISLDKKVYIEEQKFVIL